MALTIPENEGESHPTGLRTRGGADLVIIPTPLGHYQVVAKGVGGIQPKITQERFTSLHQAKEAVKRWHNSILPKIITREVQLEAMQRRKEKNGEG